VERALEELPGVLAAHVDMATKDVHVTYAPGKVSPAAMAAVIARVDLRLQMRHWGHWLVARLRRHP